MEIIDYIRSEISKHMNKYSIRVHKNDIEEMIEEVLKGTYAFQIIYNTLNDKNFAYSLHSFIPINHRKIVFRRDEEESYYAGYSYDGGKRFQWTEMETLVIDSSIIREIKINQII